MLKIFNLYQLLLVQSFLLVAEVADAASNVEICKPVLVSDLITCIHNANASLVDNIIDLGGRTFTLTTADNTTPDGNNGLPEISKSLGTLAIVNGSIERNPNAAQNFRFFYVQSEATLSLYDITLDLGNSDTSNGGNGNGGAIYNNGILNLLNCTLTANTALNNGGGIYDNGISSNIGFSTFANNLATNGNGGGYYNISSILTIDKSTFSDNGAINGEGGGVYNAAAASVPQASITNSTFSRNFATNGAGLANDAGYIFNIINNTFFCNGVLNLGGGIYNDKGATIFNLLNNTIVNNTAITAGGGIFNSSNGPTTISNLISNLVANNTSSGGAGSGPDICAGNNCISSSGSVISSESNNLISSTDGNDLLNGVNSDIVTTNPLIGPLQYNGGPTFTIALLPGSLAINNGANPSNLNFDQRGSNFFRTVFAVPDIGAFEVQE